VKGYKYFRHYKGEPGKEELTEKEAIEYLARFYRNSKEVLETSSREMKINSPFAYVWREKIKEV